MTRKITKVELPPELDTPQFREAWELWIKYRKQRKKPCTPLAMTKQLNNLVRWTKRRGLGYAIDMIGLAIDSEWVTLWEKEPINKTGQSKALTKEQMQARGMR